MSDREPTQVINLDRYGNAALPWSRSREQLVTGTPKPEITFFLCTVGPDGRPHAAGVGAAWLDGDLYFTSGPGTRKSPPQAPPLGGEPRLHDLGPVGGRRPRTRWRGDAGHRQIHAGADRRHLPGR